MFVIALCGCTAEPILPESSEIAQTRSVETDVQRTNPYRLSIVQDALYDICAEKGIDSIRLNPTDYYIRFKPQDSVQMDKLRSLDVLLFNYPLDRMITNEEMDAYRTTNKDSLYFYSVVPVDMEFPDTADVSYEILDNVYIQRENNSRSNGQLLKGLYDEVLLRTMQLTGNATRGKSVRTTWSPSARLYYSEDIPFLCDKNLASPLKGVKVVVSDFYNTGCGITNKSGETGNIAGLFPNPVVYSVHWEDPKWRISERELSSWILMPMIYIGETKQSAWHHSFEKSTPSHTSKELCAAGAHKSLYEYYYGTNQLTAGLTKFMPNNQLNVEFVFFENIAMAAQSCFPNEILLYPVWGREPSKRRYYPKYTINSIIFHELGHFILNDVSGVEADRAVEESWCEFVEDLYMEALYPGYFTNERIPVDGSFSQGNAGFYTGIGLSLISNGLTPGQIENSIKGVVTWDEWKQSVKSLGVLDSRKVDLIFEYPNAFYSDLNNLITGSETVIINEPTTYSLSSKVCTLTAEWSFAGAGGVIIKQSEDDAIFRFTSPGEKIIKASITCPDGKEKLVQTKKVYVSDYPLQTSAKAPFECDKTYKLYYNVPEGSTNIYLTINQYMFLNYIDIPITHNKAEKSFSFKFPKDFYLDYAVILTYTHNAREKTAHVVMSNIRER